MVRSDDFERGSRAAAVVRAPGRCRAPGVRRAVLGVVVVVVSVAATLSCAFPAAGAAVAWAYDHPDSGDFFAECNITYQTYSYSTSGTFALLSTFDSSSTYGWTIPSGGASSLDTYMVGYDWQDWCNTAIQSGQQGSGSSGMAMDISPQGSAYTGGAGDYGGFSTDGHYYQSPYEYTNSSTRRGLVCLAPSFTASSVYLNNPSDQDSWANDICDPTWTCWLYNPSSTYSTAGGGTQCRVDSAQDTSAAPLEPTIQWGTQGVSLPSPPAPNPNCSDTVDSSTDTASFTATTGTASTGETFSGSWNFGDGSATSNTLDVDHTYTSTGPYSAVLTVTATGDGVNYAGTTTAVCDLTVQFATSTPGGGSGSGGGPTSCSFYDVVCEIEAAISWLVVPGTTFVNAWSTFIVTLATTVPFAYMYQAASFVGSFTTQLQADVSAAPGCFALYPNGDGFGDSPCVSVGTLQTVVQVAVGAGVVIVMGLLLWHAVRKAMSQ